MTGKEEESSNLCSWNESHHYQLNLLTVMIHEQAGFWVINLSAFSCMLVAVGLDHNIIRVLNILINDTQVDFKDISIANFMSVIEV
jgi:hypothetical protein